ncbi:MAG: hypothetical protein QOD67_3013, partial [Caballeronia sp.]|nr:hypothetical protein [Caballeronia sp.]
SFCAGVTKTTMRSLGLVVMSASLSRAGKSERPIIRHGQRHLMRFRCTRRCGKPRNQRFHHIVLPTSRARGHSPRATLRTLPASTACNIEMTVLQPPLQSPEVRPLRRTYLPRRPVTRHLLTKKSCRCRCRALEFFKMRCYSARGRECCSFSYNAITVTRGNAQPVRGQRRATQQSGTIFMEAPGFSAFRYRSGRSATHRLHGEAGHGFSSPQHLSLRGFMALRTGRLRGAPFNPSHANHQTTEFLERSTR